VQNGVIGPAQATLKPEFHAAASARIPNICGLLDAFRAAQLEVIYTIIDNLTEDGRDRSLDYKLSSFNIAKGSWEAHTIDEIAPQSDEIVLRKTSSSPSTPPASTICCAISASSGRLHDRPMHRPCGQGRR
jgi:nicotinamidase-related amidase